MAKNSTPFPTQHFASPNTQPTKMRTTYVTANGNEYPIWKDGTTGSYYIVDKNGKRSDFTNKNAIKMINQNRPVCISKESYNKGTSVRAASPAVNAGSGGGGGGGSYGGGGGGGNYGGGYDADISALRQQIDELVKPKVWTADELADHFGVKDKYNMDYWLKTYNDATNKYYTDAINTQQGINKDAERSNAAYANSLLKSYVNGYLNAAPTAVGRGTLAANALSSMLGADKANEEASANLNDIINTYKEKWDYEKEQNKILAREKYNDMGQWLLDRGVGVNTAEVQNYINSLKAYDTAYSGIRNAQSNLASTAAAAYQNNANAALARNQYAASQADNNFLRKAYQMYYGNGWETAYNNANKDSSTYNTQKSSAN